MSSSKVIKKSTSGREPVSGFRYNALPPVERRNQAVRMAEGFAPLVGGGEAAEEHLSAPTTPAEPKPTLVMEEHPESPNVLAIAEEEMDRQLLDAFDKGVLEGKRQAEKGMANVFKSLREASTSLNTLWQQLLHDGEEELLHLSIMVAKKVIQQEVEQDRRILGNIIAAAVNSTAERHDIVIRLNPEEYRLVNANRHLYLGGVEEEKSLSLKSDETVMPGGCIVDTPIGAIDARVEEQLDEIWRRLKEERPQLIEQSVPLVSEVEQYGR
jgi:flagellar assembly protein FliH